MAVSLCSSIAKRCSHLNAALVCTVSKRLVRFLRFTPVGLSISRTFRWHYMVSVRGGAGVYWF
ncbi:hypothetical protein CGJ60_23550 [Vibrio parahaemolyticus]|nr:hypothetical protein CGJ60_23550 [Vibrio parahaemolyticus]